MFKGWDYKIWEKANTLSAKVGERGEKQSKAFGLTPRQHQIWIAALLYTYALCFGVLGLMLGVLTQLRVLSTTIGTAMLIPAALVALLLLKSRPGRATAQWIYNILLKNDTKKHPPEGK